MEPTNNPVPKHVGIILDGNRRFAKKLMLKPWKGHEWGAKKVEAVLSWCKELNVQELTLYSFSIQNFDRPKEEFNYLMKLFVDTFTRMKDDPRVKENDIRVQFIGRKHLFPEEVQQAMRDAEEATKTHKTYLLNMAMAYGGQEEILDATKKIAEEVQKGNVDTSKINKEYFEEHLYIKDQPDMVIRTGGDKRSSNFLCYQSAYSEWFYLEKTWPEFEKEDFTQCIKEYMSRDRRFGK